MGRAKFSASRLPVPVSLYVREAGRYRPASFSELRGYFCRMALSRSRRNGDAVQSPAHLKRLLVPYFAGLDHEVFSVLFLDTRNRLIAIEDLFRGTINACQIYPREIVKRVVTCAAAAVVLAHNHPSGDPEPSGADIQLTHAIVAALSLIDVPVFDHIVVGGREVQSLACLGLLEPSRSGVRARRR